MLGPPFQGVAVIHQRKSLIVFPMFCRPPFAFLLQNNVLKELFWGNAIIMLNSFDLDKDTSM